MAILLAVPAVTSADASCTDTWTGNAGDGLWQSGENWSTNSAPGVEDVACIGAGTTVHVTASSNIAAVLQDLGTLVIAGGSLELRSTEELSTVGSLRVEGGTLAGAGTVDVAGSLSWTGGTMSGVGTTVVQSGATGSIAPGSGSSVALTERDLVNEGTLTLVSGSVAGRSSAEIDNSGTFDLNADAPGSEWWEHGLLKSDGSDVWLHNTGVVKKATGGQFGQIQFQFDNEGAVEVESGQLIFSGGGHGSDAAKGSWKAIEGTSLAFSGGSFLLGAGVEMSGLVFLAGGNVQVGDIQAPDATLLLWSGGSTLDVTGAATSSHLGTLEQHSNTTLTGAGTLDVSSSLVWGANSTMSGSGVTVLQAGATGSIDPGSGSAVALSERKLVNDGTLTLASGSVEGRLSAEIENSGTFDVNADAPGSEWWEHGLLNSDGSDVWVHNTGTVKKASGGQFTQIQFKFDNEGAVEVESGQMIFTGGSHGSNAATGSWHSTEGTSLAFSGGSFLLGSGVDMSGTVFLAGGNVQAGDIQASAATLQLWSGGSTLDLTDAATPSHLGTFEQHSNTTLTGAGTLDVSSSLVWGANSTMSGLGVTMLQAGATGSIEASSGCEPMRLEGRRLLNEGSLTFSWGTLLFSAGAQLENNGTFKDNTEASCYGPQIQVSSGGGAPSVLNHGNFEKTGGGGTGTVAVSFENDGNVEAHTGRLAFADGGIPQQVATGTWTPEGGSLTLTGGTFLIGEEVDLSAVEVSGATVEREPVSGPPRGYLNAQPYAARTVVVSGTGSGIGSGFSSAAIEVAPAGSSEWQPLCGPLTPGLGGEYSCEWSTASGSLPDGAYQLRAQLSDASTPARTAPTAPIDVLVDNTPPTGTVSGATELSGAELLQGTATDGGSGVASWQLQIAPAGSAEWTSACPAQGTPTGGSAYQCSVDTTSYANGAYQLRALITDNAGNVYTTAATATAIDNTPPANTGPPVVAGTAQDEQTLTVSPGSWTGTLPMTYAFQWQSCESSGASCADIEGATGSSFTLRPGDVGSTLRVLVTATNFKGSASSASAASSVVLGAPPSSIAPPTISGIAQEGRTLTASTGSWIGTPPLSYGYQWQRCDSGGASCIDIVGATASSLAVDSSSVGGTLRVDVIATNADGSASSSSIASALVVDASPLVGDQPWISGSAVVGATLTASGGTWSGAEPISYSYQWQSCSPSGASCTPIEGSTASTYSPAEGDLGHSIEVVVKATNSAGSAQASSPFTAVVQGSAGGSACGDTWTGAAGDGSWETAGNWITGKVPSGSDHVCILTTATVTVTGSSDQAGWITSEGTIAVTSRGVLSVNGPSTSTLSKLTIDRGTLTGAGEVDITDTFSGGGYGSLEGSGTTVIEPGATGVVTATGGSGLYLSGRTLRNAGTLTVGRESGLQGEQAAQLINSGTLVVNGEDAGSNHGLVAGNATLTNTGTIEKTEGTGNSPIEFALDNEGIVETSSGTLEMTGGGTSGEHAVGSWSAPGAGSAIVFRGSNKTFALGTNVPMSGAIEVAEGTVTAGVIEGQDAAVTLSAGRSSLEVFGTTKPSTLANLTIEGGTLSGAAEVDVTNTFTGGGYGWLSGPGSTVLEPTATGTMTPGWVTLEGRTLSNAGTLTIGKQSGINGQRHAHIANSGTLVVNGESSSENHGLIASPGEAMLTNTGILKKAEGTGATRIGYAVDNESTIVAETGELEFGGGANSGQLTSDTWSASSGASIAFNEFYSASYSLGEQATLAGHLTMDSSVTAGTIEGANADLTSQLGNLTLTGIASSTLNSLTFAQPEPSYKNEQDLSIASELEVISNVTWSSNDAFFTSGTLVTAQSATTLFNPSAWIQIRGGQFVNEGKATWATGGFQANESGTFFINIGTFEANQDGGNPFVQGCQGRADGYACPVFENDGLFTARFPTDGWWPGQILWRVNFDNYGRLEVPYEMRPECKWEYSETPGPGTEACYRAIREFKGLLLEEGAEMHGVESCGALSETSCWGEEEPVSGEEGEAAMYPDPEGGEEEQSPLATRFTFAFNSPTYSETLCPSKYPCGRYQGASAASYGERWVLAGETEEELEQNVNHEYNFYGGDGGDCTNFVSQALKAGGMRFMRAHGRSSPNGGGQSQEEEDEAVFLKGQGSWWSYYTNIPLESSETYVHSYTPTESFVRAGKLYNHLLEYGLVRVVKAHEAVHPGDVVFYDLFNPSLAAQSIDHAQLVVKAPGSSTATWVAQHSPSYVHSLGYVVRRWEAGHGAVNRNWAYVILEPTHTAANIVG